MQLDHGTSVLLSWLRSVPSSWKMERCNHATLQLVRCNSTGVYRTRIRLASRKRRSRSVKALLRDRLCFLAPPRLEIDLPFGCRLSCFEASEGWTSGPARLVHVSEALGGAVRGLLQGDGTEEGRQHRGQRRGHGDSRSTQEEGQTAGPPTEQQEQTGQKGRRKSSTGQQQETRQPPWRSRAWRTTSSRATAAQAGTPAAEAEDSGSMAGWSSRDNQQRRGGVGRYLWVGM